MEQGWVYVLVNSSMPGLVKVGRTTRPPAERVAELSAATGVATPFVLAFEQAFADCVQAEQDIHAVLDARGMRVAVNREFFGGPAAEIVRVVLQAAAEAQGGPDVQMPVASAQELLAEGDRHLFGQGDTFEDGSEACRFYKLAAARGCVVAPERLGAVYGQVDSRSRSGRRRAIKYLKEGARRGNYYCYVEMAVLFAAVRHEANFRKAWDRFFADRAASPCAEAEAGEFRYVVALRRYVCGCIDMQLPPAHLAELSAEAAPLMHHLLAALHQLCNNSEQRMRLAGALRWTYENLAPRPVDTQRAPQGWVQGWVQRLETA